MASRKEERRHRIILIRRIGLPDSEGAEFVVGPADPQLTLEDIKRAARDPKLVHLKDRQIAITATTTDDEGYTMVQLVPVGDALDFNKPFTPACRKVRRVG
ncbi:MAG: hypothetical protein AAB518_00325 [Patescibacteria group bacterium]